MSDQQETLTFDEILEQAVIYLSLIYRHDSDADKTIQGVIEDAKVFAFGRDRSQEVH